MKTIIPLLILLFLTGCNGTKNIQGESAKKEIATITSIADISIEGMACQAGCADAIQLNLNKLKGVKSSEVSFNKGQAIIEFDSNQISLEEIQKTITDTKVKDYIYTIKNVSIKNSATQ